MYENPSYTTLAAELSQNTIEKDRSVKMAEYKNNTDCFTLEYNAHQILSTPIIDIKKDINKIYQISI
jgi:hypothetical protein